MAHSPAADSPPDNGDRSPTPSRDQSTGLGSRVQRGAGLARLGASTSAGLLASKLRGLREGSAAEERFHAETAEKVVELLGSMKGAAMKLGQIASFVDLDLPPEVQATYHEVLADLRSQAPPMDPDRIAAVIATEFGAPPETVFARWDRIPLASASIGQVHRAALVDGTEVVAKVQYPGIAEAVESDLANVAALAPIAKLVSPNLRVRPLMEELRARVIDELDYQREAQYQGAFHARYDGHPFIRVPRVYTDYCRPRVLVSEYIQGDSFDTMVATASPELRQRYAEIIYRFVFGSLNRFRLFNGDPHPGNYLFLADGSVAFLDFGSVKMFSTERRELLQSQLRCVLAADADALVEIMRAEGFIAPGQTIDAERMLKWFRLFHRPVLDDSDWTYTPEFARDVIRSSTDPRGGYADLLRKINMPPDYLLLNRIQWGVNSILGRLSARANWHRIAQEFWDAGPAATPLGKAEFAFIKASPYLV